ncbi:excisionase family DNA-binding protein [Mycobacterium paraense]|uniref:excisionase family DNA-binding protein n=1 Tax=Mycobacterium paraense TaxID=767916 RepID=UPI000A162683|nr:excisionase family DNA-binding protein [Mycobacterium paraense]
MPNHLISIDQAAERLGASTRTVRRLIASGKLPAYRVSRELVRIKPEDLETLLEPVIPNGKMGY